MDATARTVVTIGPTLTREETRRHLPDAEIRPPIAADQVLRWQLRPGDRLLIIDGLFLQATAVRHKELLALIDDGVQVTGASSMGALRAAELHPFGMRGIGSVFHAYRDHTIVGDDEVALLHAGADAGHRALSWALVDLRHALEGARRRGVVDEETADLLLRTAADLPFTARDAPTLYHRAQEHGACAAALARFHRYCRKHRPSIKRSDAVMALRLLSLTGPAAAGTPRPAHGTHDRRLTYHGVPVPLAETVFLRSWRQTPTTTTDPSDRAVPDRPGAEEVVGTLALTWDGYPGFFRDLAAEQLLAAASGSRPIDAGPVPPMTEGPSRPGAAGTSGTPDAPDAPDAPDTPDTPSASWPELSSALHDRLEQLGLPSTPQQAEAHLNLLRPPERSLPWREAGPLLATRLWRSSSLLDWATPAVTRLEHHPVFHEAHEAVARARARSGDLPPTTEQDVRDTCRRLLAGWRVEHPEDLLPTLRARGFLDPPDFVRAVRRHHPLLPARRGAGP